MSLFYSITLSALWWVNFKIYASPLNSDLSELFINSWILGQFFAQHFWLFWNLSWKGIFVLCKKMQILQQHPKYTYFYNYKFCYNCFLIMIMIVYRDYQPGAPAENRQSVSTVCSFMNCLSFAHFLSLLTYTIPPPSITHVHIPPPKNRPLAY